MNRQAQAVVMLLFGGAIVRASVTDMYLRYVKESLRPFLIAAGLVLIAAAVMTLVHEVLRPRARAGGDDAEPADHGHDHGDGKPHREPWVAWLLILPVLGLLLVAPPALGSYAAGQAGTALSSQQASDYPPLPPGDPAKISVLDYASRAVFDKGVSLGDRTVQLTGFIAQGPNGEPILARIILSCCAADGRPIKLGMSGNAPAGLASDTWVEVVGKYTDRTVTDPVNEETIPYIEVETWTQIDPPKQQYE
ncbi:TIGR03943 family protein [Phytohabitans sp. ZYX-F-186]|uniref:TIGR03943 family protein n=1 Tax=Phytohabitans maris TaxID=3071409 RepID=A0ABU0Z7D1_9ACTN|nr:TIGR03943 family protein [Phytohabitans sp. ZYX-F-186]MDQ7902965.1 TIGR03943 family protein [Phytohabitans sp. ZYX-F-186]